MCRNIQVTALLGHIPVDDKYFSWVTKEGSTLTGKKGSHSFFSLTLSGSRYFHISGKIGKVTRFVKVLPLRVKNSLLFENKPKQDHLKGR